MKGRSTSWWEALLLLAALLAICTAAKGQVTIEGPDEVELKTPAWYSISGQGSAAFFPVDQLTIGPPHIRDGHALFWASAPGTYTLHGIAVDWDARTFQIVQKRVLVKGVEPPDPPDPPGPQPGAKQVCFFRESGTLPSLPFPQQILLSGLVIRDELKKAGHLFVGSFDPDETGPGGTVPKKLAPWFKSAEGADLPAMLVAPKDGGTITVHPCPADAAEMWKVLGGGP